MNFSLEEALISLEGAILSHYQFDLYSPPTTEHHFSIYYINDIFLKYEASISYHSYHKNFNNERVEKVPVSLTRIKI